MKAGLAIEELAAEIMRQNEIKEDYVVNSNSLLMEAFDSELYLRVMDENMSDRLEPLAISENAHIPLWWPQERPVPMRVPRGPFGIPLPLMPGPKTLCELRAGT